MLCAAHGPEPVSDFTSVKGTVSEPVQNPACITAGMVRGVGVLFAPQVVIAEGVACTVNWYELGKTTAPAG